VRSSVFQTQWVIWLRQGILLVGGILLAILLGLAWIGFPGFLTRWILAATNQGEYFVAAHDVKLDLRGGIKASDVKVYRKGVIGSPLLETQECRVLFHLFEKIRPGESRIKGLWARGGVIRPAWKLARGEGKTVPPEEYSRSTGLRVAAARSMDMDIILMDFDVLGVWVEQVSVAFKMDEGGIHLSRLNGLVGRDLQRGKVEGSLAWKADQQVSGRLITSFDPRALAPACRSFYPEAISTLERFSFSSAPPRLDLSFEACLKKPVSVSAKGRIQAANYAYRGAGIGFVNMTGAYDFGNGTNRLKLDPFLMVVGGRNARGRVEFDFNQDLSTFAVVSEVDLATVLRLIGVRESMIESWQLGERAHVEASGRFNLREPERSAIEASVEGEKIEYGAVRADEYAFHYSVTGLTNHFTNIRGKLGGGSFSGSAMVTADRSGSNRVARVKAEIIHVDANALLKAVTSNRLWRTDGKMYGTIDLTSGADDGVSGQGQMTLRDARLLRLPVMAGLVDEVFRRFPGNVEYKERPVGASGSFEVKGGRVSSRDLRIEGGVVDFAFQGSFGIDETLEGTVLAEFTKNPGLLGDALSILHVADKGIGFKVGGTLDKPVWSVSRKE